MKTKIKQGFISFPLALVLILGAFALWGNLTVSAATYSGECGASLTWELDTDTGVLTISGTGDMQNYSSSNSPWYDYRESIKSVVLSNGVTSIGILTFWNCTSLTSVVIPDSVTSIEQSAFAGCTSLESVGISDSVTSIGYNAFAGCRSLASIEIPNSVTSIGQNAFANCTSLASVAIPNSVTFIGSYAFIGCTSLASVAIPNSVKSIEYYTFYECTNLTSIKIPDSVTSIGGSAFYGCRSLASIEIPDSVISIGSSAFVHCVSIASIVIPNSVTSIGENAFNGCRSLASVVIPDSVTSIGKWAFVDCTALDEVYFASVEPPTVVTSAFLNVKSGARAIVPENWGEGENGVAEGSKWNGLIVVYGEYAEPEPKVCEYCHIEIVDGDCDCVKFSGGLKGDGKGKLGEIVTEPTGDNKTYIKGEANGTTLSDVTDGSGKVNVYEIIDGKEVPVTGDDTKLGTGMIIRNGAEEIIVVITGDLTGKGKPNIKDAQVYLESLVGNTTLDTAQALATDGIIAGKTESDIKNLRSFLNSVMKAGT